mmetsp:Transcript_50876/g.111208  ORF Transcript_50876/g.111208 Transcript_50876/m.111208 type:complete len:386 (-) Transcript_50876:271-1428(-)
MASQLLDALRNALRDGLAQGEEGDTLAIDCLPHMLQPRLHGVRRLVRCLAAVQPLRLEAVPQTVELRGTPPRVGQQLLHGAQLALQLGKGGARGRGLSASSADTLLRDLAKELAPTVLEGSRCGRSLPLRLGRLFGQQRGTLPCCAEGGLELRDFLLSSCARLLQAPLHLHARSLQSRQATLLPSAAAGHGCRGAWWCRGHVLLAGGARDGRPRGRRSRAGAAPGAPCQPLPPAPRQGLVDACKPRCQAIAHVPHEPMMGGNCIDACPLASRLGSEPRRPPVELGQGFLQRASSRRGRLGLPEHLRCCGQGRGGALLLFGRGLRQCKPARYLLDQRLEVCRAVPSLRRGCGLARQGRVAALAVQSGHEACEAGRNVGTGSLKAAR